VTRQGSAMICPTCDALCLPVAEQEANEAKARMRARPLMDELGTVFGYPLSDKMGFVILAVVETLLVGVLGLIPLAGKFLGAFVDSYAYLVIGCLLGLAVFKKAAELGLD
jgi:hypothetical protein